MEEEKSVEKLKNDTTDNIDSVKQQADETKLKEVKEVFKVGLPINDLIAAPLIAVSKAQH